MLIDHRPEVVARRGRVGDWEGDLIIGRSSRSAIGTLVDRASRYIKLIHLPDGHSAEQLHTALSAVLDDLPDDVLWTLTWDQGSGMAHHHLLADKFRDGVFFAHPASPWQRPTNENTNGLPRQYFPREATWPFTTRPRCAWSKIDLTTGHASSTTGTHQLRSSLTHCHHEPVTVATITRIRPTTRHR